VFTFDASKSFLLLHHVQPFTEQLPVAEIRWQKQSVRGTLPERECHSASAIDNKRIYIFGGATYDGTYHYYDDTTLVDTGTQWSLSIWSPDLLTRDPVSMQSFNVETRGEVPESRAGHSATVLPNGKIFLFGGEGVVDGCYFNDSFTFDPGTPFFTPIYVSCTNFCHQLTILGAK
jgi:hypothetical protein